MARLIRPLRQWPLMHYHHCCSLSAFHSIQSLSSTVSTQASCHRLSFATLPSSTSSHLPYRASNLRLSDDPLQSEIEEGGGNNSDSDSDVKKSRNLKKREARRAVRWGMEMASFSSPQIKRILRVASLEREVFDALMLAKRLGPDVREGKRRQFNYIGKLLRDVKPDLMDALILSTKDGDWHRLRAFSDSVADIFDIDDDELEESECEEEDEEGSHEYIEIATRWFEGLINKDMDITNEVYAVNTVDFDRQELRKLVRKVHAIQEQESDDVENKQKVDAALASAKKSLARFLRALAKQMPGESNFVDL